MPRPRLTRRATLALAAAASAAAAPIASAGVHTIDLPAVGALEDPVAVLLPQFDGDIADLTGITITLNSDFTGVYQLENLGSTTPFVTMQRDWEHVIASSIGGVPGDALLTTSAEWTGEAQLGPSDGVIDFGGPGGFTAMFGFEETASFEIDPTAFGDFVGGGDVELFYDFNSFFEFNIQNNESTLVIGTSDSSGTLSIEYAVIPAPGVLSLLTLGAMAGTRRRRG